MNKSAVSIFLTTQIFCFTSAVAQAETPRTTPMLGVSSAWTGGELMESHPLESRRLQLASAEMNSRQSASASRTPSNVQRDSQPVKSDSQSSGDFKFFDENFLESVFDKWQLNIKHLIAEAPSRMTAFSNWASQKIGFSRKGNVIDYKVVPTRATSTSIQVHMQPVNNNHRSWLTSDGRLKTVTAH